MESWKWSTMILCLYGFFKEIRPSEPYLTEYLMSPRKNLTYLEVSSEIYPAWTYSSLTVVIFVFVVTDFLRYKPIIIVQGVCYVITWSLLLWAPGVIAMQLMQVVYSIVTASDVAYFTYIYASVPVDNFKTVTGFTRSARLFGQFFSGTIAQVIVSMKPLNYLLLNYISLGCVTMALVIACFLPSIPNSIYFHRSKSISSSQSEPTVYGTSSVNPVLNSSTNECDSDRQGVWERMKNDFRESYSSTHQLKWCLWWALSMCIYDQVGNYVQPLWEEIYPSTDNPDRTTYNGAVTAVNTLLGAIVSASVGMVTIDLSTYGEIYLALISFFEGFTILTSALTNNIWVAYVCYALFNCSYDMLIAVVSYQVAGQLKRDSYGLVFGCNTFVALLLGTIVTLAIVSKTGFHLDTRYQFVVYSGTTFCTAVVFLTFAIHRFLLNNFIKKDSEL